MFRNICSKPCASACSCRSFANFVEFVTKIEKSHTFASDLRVKNALNVVVFVFALNKMLGCTGFCLHSRSNSTGNDEYSSCIERKYFASGRQAASHTVMVEMRKTYRAYYNICLFFFFAAGNRQTNGRTSSNYFLPLGQCNVIIFFHALVVHPECGINSKCTYKKNIFRIFHRILPLATRKRAQISTLSRF